MSVSIGSEHASDECELSKSWSIAARFCRRFSLGDSLGEQAASFPKPGYTQETLESLSRGRLFEVGRLQRGNNGVHCRVYRPVRNNDTLPRGLSSRLFRIRFSCRGSFADRDEIDRTRTMDKLGNICDRELSPSSLLVRACCTLVELDYSSRYNTPRPSATTRSAGRAS